MGPGVGIYPGVFLCHVFCHCLPEEQDRYRRATLVSGRERGYFLVSMVDFEQLLTILFLFLVTAFCA